MDDLTEAEQELCETCGWRPRVTERNCQTCQIDENQLTEQEARGDVIDEYLSTIPDPADYPHLFS